MPTSTSKQNVFNSIRKLSSAIKCLNFASDTYSPFQS